MVQVNGPRPAATNDKKLFSEKFLLDVQKKQQERNSNFRVIADGGYYSKKLEGALSFRNELRSTASAQMKADIEAGKHLEMKPKKIYEGNPVYHDQFGLTTFRKHLYQRRDCEAKRAIRFEKKKARAKYPELLENHPRFYK